MKKIYLLLLTVVCALAFAGCDNADEITEEISLEIVSSDIGFEAVGGSGSISLMTSEANIKAVSNKSWLTIDSTTPTTVNYTVSENTEALQRSAKITLSVKNLKREVTILQNGCRFDLSSDPIAIDPTGITASYIAFDTTLDSDPQISIPQDAQQWLSATVEEGAIKLTASLNYSKARSTVITITQGWKPVEITVTQEMVDLLDTKEIAIDREQTSVKVTPTEYLEIAASSWDIKTSDSWISLQKEDGYFIVTASENTSGSLRTGTVQVIADNGEVLFSLPVRQKIYSYEFFAGEWTMNYNDSGNGATSTVKVTLFTTEDRTGYTMNGLSVNNIKIGYDDSGSAPKLTMQMQYLGILYSTYYLYLCPWEALVEGYFTWAAGTGADLVYNMDEKNQTLSFQDNGVWGDYQCNSLIIYAFTSDPPSSSGAYTGLAKYPGISSFTR